MEKDAALSGLGRPILSSKNTLLVFTDIVAVPHYLDNPPVPQHSQPYSNILLRQRFELILLPGLIPKKHYVIGWILHLSLYWDKTSKYGIIAGMITGTLITIFWKLFLKAPTGIYELIPAFFGSALVIVIVSLLSPKK